MSPGPRVRQNAGVPDDPVRHDESVEAQNRAHGELSGLA